MQTSMPVFFMVYYINHRLELASNYMKSSLHLAQRWHDEALGVLLMIEDYVSSGNVLSDVEKEAFNKAREWQMIVNTGLEKREQYQREGIAIYPNGNGSRR